VLVGFQAMGTRGRALQDGTERLRMFGREIPVHARVETLDGLSAHADRDELLRWLGGFERPPRATYLVHGEPSAANAFQETVTRRLGWEVHLAQHGQKVEIA
jgi:metallo-beta-lactamase family protein